MATWSSCCDNDSGSNIGGRALAPPLTWDLSDVAIAIDVAFGQTIETIKSFIRPLSVGGWDTLFLCLASFKKVGSYFFLLI